MVHHQPDHPQRDQPQARQLRRAQRPLARPADPAGTQAIGPQPLDPQPPAAVHDRVAQRDIAGPQPAAQPPLEPQQQPEARQVPDRLVQERRVEQRVGRVGGHVVVGRQPVLGVDPHPEAEVGRAAVGLLVHEVAPAPNRLRQEERRHADIQPAQQRQPVQAGVDQRRENRPDQRAVDRQAAAGGVDDIQQREAGEARPLEGDVVQARADHAQHHPQQQQVPDVLRILPAHPRAVGRHVAGQDRAADDQHAVPAHHQRDAEDRRVDQKWVVGWVESHSSLFV